MRTILVDDEIWMLKQFETECETIPDIQLVGVFKSAEKALEFAQNERIDLAFLDMEMPEMSGLELAKKLRKLYPQMIVIFVSAHDVYMVDAFRSRCADYYVLKPYKKEDVEAAIERAKLLAKRLEKRIFIHTFGKFDVFVDGEPIQFASMKAKELLAILVDRHGGVVDAEEAFSVMWEDKYYDHTQAGAYRRALQKLQATLKTYGIEDMLVYLPHGRAIKRDAVDCDYFSFLDGDAKAIRTYSGEYMSDYSWGEYTLASLDQQKLRYDPESLRYE